MRRPLTMFVVILASAFLRLSETGAADEVSAINSALVVLSGNDSHVSTRAYQRVTSAADWKKTWLDHLGLRQDTICRTAMEIDFDRCIVVAVFGGTTWNLCGFQVDSVREDNDVILVRFIDIGYQTAGPDGGGDRVTPYAFIVLPRSDKPIVLEETIRSLDTRDAPIWKEVARLGAAKK